MSTVHDRPAPLSDTQLMALASWTLASRRSERYRGDGMSCSLDTFTPDDAARLRQLYDALQHIHAALSGDLDQPETACHALSQVLDAVGWSVLIKDIRRLGQTTYALHDTQVLRETIHDIRGGALTLLSLYIPQLQRGEPDPAVLLRLFFLSRDHLKIMRNAIPDLDRERYQRDIEGQSHSVQLLVEKWQIESPVEHPEVTIDCRFDGHISETCVEFAALDRMLYNLINNAFRHASTPHVHVHLVVLPSPEQPSHDLRFVVSNPIDHAQRRRLEARFGDTLGDLFLGGFTTGGSGLGMRIVAEFAANAYGLNLVEDAIAQGYVGVSLVDDQFVVWFHWPVVE